MFRKILLWFGLMLGFSLFAFLATNYWLTPRARFSGEMMRRLTEFQLSEAIRAYQTGGPESLRETLARIDAGFPARHSLLDGSRRDLVTGLQYSQDDPAFDPPKKSVLPVAVPALAPSLLPDAKTAPRTTCWSKSKAALTPSATSLTTGGSSWSSYCFATSSRGA